MLRKASVVDAGAAGLVEIVRGIAAYISRRAAPGARRAVPLTADAIHLEASRYRYCTAFVVEGQGLDRAGSSATSRRSETRCSWSATQPRSRRTCTRTIPGSALRAGTAIGVIERVEISNMQLQTFSARSGSRNRSSDDRRTAVVAVVAGEGNRRLFESMGATGIVDGGETMNPSTEELLEAIEARTRPRPSCWRTTTTSSSPRARRRASRECPSTSSRRARSRPASARCSPTTRRDAAANATAMEEPPRRSRPAASRLRRARSASMDCRSSAAPTSASSTATPSRAERASTPSPPRSSKRLLAEPRDVLTLITGADEPELGPLLAQVAERHPELELEVHPGGQPHYPLLLSAE